MAVYRELPMYRRYDCSALPKSEIHDTSRLCRPERFEIRRTIHTTLVSHTMKLDQFISREVDASPDQEFPLAGVVQDLNTLVRLFDEILLEEYCDDHGSLDDMGVQQGCLICSFCGSCLFLSSFSCNKCSQETSGPVLVCPGCYVEGRTCKCGIMIPVRLGNFQDTLEDRNNAVNALSNGRHLHHMSTEGLVEISERYEPSLPRYTVHLLSREEQFLCMAEGRGV